MTRATVVAVVLFVLVPGVSLAQTTTPLGTPERVAGVPVILWEHGDPFFAVPPALTLAGSVVFDIATAPASARSYNTRNPATPKSPSTAFMLSLASTGVPVAAGVLVANSSSAGAGVILISGGVVIGPSVGHWYAGRVGRGLATAGARLGLTVLAGLAALAAS